MPEGDVTMIDGVKTKQLKVIPDERGRLMEILRSDDSLFEKFGQVYMTTTYPGVVKAWHLHKKQTDNVACIQGMIKLVIFDPRENSPTRRELNEFYLGTHNPLLVQIPTGVFHGWACVSEEEAIVVNIPNRLYDYEDPDEHRLDPHRNDIPYDWKRKDG
jgi:dTDP-4-dehydrorhamnose 3,5-epimerase